MGGYCDYALKMSYMPPRTLVDIWLAYFTARSIVLAMIDSIAAKHQWCSAEGPAAQHIAIGLLVAAVIVCGFAAYLSLVSTDDELG